MEKWIYQIEIVIDEQIKNEILENNCEEDIEILSAIESLPFVVSTNLRYALSENLHKKLKSDLCDAN